jgi:hypothetical protein
MLETAYEQRTKYQRGFVSHVTEMEEKRSQRAYFFIQRTMYCSIVTLFERESSSVLSVKESSQSIAPSATIYPANKFTIPQSTSLTKHLRTYQAHSKTKPTLIPKLKNKAKVRLSKCVKNTTPPTPAPTASTSASGPAPNAPPGLA